MTTHDLDGVPGPDAALDALFNGMIDAGRRAPAEPSGALLARVLSDALAVQDARSPAAAGRAARLSVPPRPASRVSMPGFWQSILAGLGGWAAVGGLATATIAGLWVGFSPPAALAGIADGVLGTAFATISTEVDQVDLLPSFDSYLTEG